MLKCYRESRSFEKKNHRAPRTLRIVSVVQRRDKRRKEREKRKRKKNAINKLAMCQFLIYYRNKIIRCTLVVYRQTISMLSVTFGINWVRDCESMSRKDIAPEKCARVYIYKFILHVRRETLTSIKIQSRMIEINRC